MFALPEPLSFHWKDVSVLRPSPVGHQNAFFDPYILLARASTPSTFEDITSNVAHLEILKGMLIGTASRLGITGPRLSDLGGPGEQTDLLPALLELVSQIPGDTSASEFAQTVFEQSALLHEVRHFYDLTGSIPGVVNLFSYYSLLARAVQGTSVKRDVAIHQLFEGGRVLPGLLANVRSQGSLPFIVLQESETGLLFPALYDSKSGSIVVLGIRTISEANCLAVQLLTIVPAIKNIVPHFRDELSKFYDRDALLVLEFVTETCGLDNSAMGSVVACDVLLQISECIAAAPGWVSPRLLPSIMGRRASNVRRLIKLHPGFVFTSLVGRARRKASIVFDKVRNDGTPLPSKSDMRYIQKRDVYFYKRVLKAAIDDWDRIWGKERDPEHPGVSLDRWMARIYATLARPLLLDRLDRELQPTRILDSVKTIPPFIFIEGKRYLGAPREDCIDVFEWTALRNIVAIASAELLGDKYVMCPLKLGTEFGKPPLDVCPRVMGCGIHSRGGEVEQPNCTFRDFLEWNGDKQKSVRVWQK